jgi:hypothetical protein
MGNGSRTFKKNLKVNVGIANCSVIHGLRKSGHRFST